MPWRVYTSFERRNVAHGVLLQVTGDGREGRLRAEVRRHHDGRIDVAFLADSMPATREAAHTFAAFVWSQLAASLATCEPSICHAGTDTMVVVIGAGARRVVRSYFNLEEDT